MRSTPCQSVIGGEIWVMLQFLRGSLQLQRLWPELLFRNHVVALSGVVWICSPVLHRQVEGILAHRRVAVPHNLVQYSQDSFPFLTSGLGQKFLPLPGQLLKESDMLRCFELFQQHPDILCPVVQLLIPAITPPVPTHRLVAVVKFDMVKEYLHLYCISRQRGN